MGADGRSEPNFNIGPKVVLSARVDAADYADRNIDTAARMDQRQRNSFVRKFSRTKHMHDLQVRAITRHNSTVLASPNGEGKFCGLKN
jgi:hypothetical protein